MKQLKVYYSNGEHDLWYIPVDETPEESIKGIQEDVGVEIVDFVKVKGY